MPLVWAKSSSCTDTSQRFLLCSTWQRRSFKDKGRWCCAAINSLSHLILFQFPTSRGLDIGITQVNYTLNLPLPRGDLELIDWLEVFSLPLGSYHTHQAWWNYICVWQKLSTLYLLLLLLSLCSTNWLAVTEWRQRSDWASDWRIRGCCCCHHCACGSWDWGSWIEDHGVFVCVAENDRKPAERCSHLTGWRCFTTLLSLVLDCLSWTSWTKTERRQTNLPMFSK